MRRRGPGDPTTCRSRRRRWGSPPLIRPLPGSASRSPGRWWGDATRKIASAEALARIARHADARGRKVVFTNGCFDLLHAGHVKLLERAKRTGDLLIVGLNSDRSVRALKGAGRPVTPQRDRALVLAALESVDYVTIFDDLTPRRLLARLKPHVLIKGADWKPSEIVGWDLVSRNGGRVIRFPLVKGQSTSELIRRIQAGPRARRR